MAVCAIVAWLLVVAYAIAAMRGGLRSPMSYAATRAPLDDGTTVPASDHGRLFWSGWTPLPPGRRSASVLDADIAFVRTTSASDCRATIAAAPTVRDKTQRVALSLNGAAPATQTIDRDAVYTIALGGGVAAGVNVLSLHFDDATPSGEFMRSIDVASLRLDCASPRP
jgi:hypothetical protein